MKIEKIAFLSGKGGTGKTLLSVNLAAVCQNSTYVDCDVEEPDGHLFFKPRNLSFEDVCVKIPAVDAARCNGCRECVEFCKYNALAYIGKVMVFDEVCHSCGGCAMLCPQNAIFEKNKPIGKIESGVSEGINVLTGILNPGEASGIPVIESLFKNLENARGKIFIDCPPGSACPVMECVKEADFCVLVAEPTVFGAHNLEMAHELVKVFKKPCAAVLNKCTDAENPSETYCLKNNLKILEKIPFEIELGALNSNGKIAAHESEKYKILFTEILKGILENTEKA